jgi:hypothetical protein
VNDDPPATVRLSPAAIEVSDLWIAYRSASAMASPCGHVGHRLALTVAPEPHRYGFQCVTCSWQSGWFSR